MMDTIGIRPTRPVTMRFPNAERPAGSSVIDQDCMLFDRYEEARPRSTPMPGGGITLPAGALFGSCPIVDSTGS